MPFRDVFACSAAFTEYSTAAAVSAIGHGNAGREGAAADSRRLCEGARCVARRARMLAHTHARAHTHINAYTHTHMNTHTKCTNIHTHSHTHLACTHVHNTCAGDVDSNAVVDCTLTLVSWRKVEKLADGAISKKILAEGTDHEPDYPYP